MEKTATKKLTYEELQKKFGELYSQYEKAMMHIQKLQRALEEESFNRTSFFVSMLFNVMEHPEQYTDEFVKWASENIMSILTEFANAFSEQGNENKNEIK